jgi:hypothetical protein
VLGAPWKLKEGEAGGKVPAEVSSQIANISIAIGQRQIPTGYGKPPGGATRARAPATVSTTSGPHGATGLNPAR